MEKLDYNQIKEMTFESFEEYFCENGFTIKQSLAASLEDNIQIMKDNKVYYNMVIISLMLIAIDNAYIPFYIFLRYNNIIDGLLCIEGYPVEFSSDVKKIQDTLQQNNITDIEKSNYDLRVAMLLSE